MQAILKHELMPVPHEFGSSLAYAVNTVMHVVCTQLCGCCNSKATLAATSTVTRLLKAM